MLNLRAILYHDPSKDITVKGKTCLVQLLDDLLLHLLSLFLVSVLYLSAFDCQPLEPYNVVRLDHVLKVANLQRILGNLAILDKVDNLSIPNHGNRVLGNLNLFHLITLSFFFLSYAYI